MGRLPDGQCDVDNTHAYSYGPKSCCDLAAARAKGRREGIEAAQRLLKKAISEATENADARLYWSAAVEIIDEARIRALSAADDGRGT